MAIYWKMSNWWLVLLFETFRQTFKEVYRKTRDEMKAEKERLEEEMRKEYAMASHAAEKRAIAAAFNKRYAYAYKYAGAPDAFANHEDHMLRGFGAYRWMCPDCNAVHAPTQRSSLGCGLVYPQCCNTYQGTHVNLPELEEAVERDRLLCKARADAFKLSIKHKRNWEIFVP